MCVCECARVSVCASVHVCDVCVCVLLWEVRVRKRL